MNIADDEGSTPLHEAALFGRRSDDEEVSIFFNSVMKQRCSDEQLSLICDLLWMESQIAELLVEAGAIINAENKDGQTPLDLAMEGNDPEDIEEMYLVAALRG